MSISRVCLPPSIVYSMQGPFPMEIHQGTELIVMRLEYYDLVRVIFMDGRPHLPSSAPHTKVGRLNRPLGGQHARRRHDAPERVHDHQQRPQPQRQRAHGRAVLAQCRWQDAAVEAGVRGSRRPRESRRPLCGVGSRRRRTITSSRTNAIRASRRTISRRDEVETLGGRKTTTRRLAADLCPAVFQRDRAIEDRPGRRRVGIHAEVTLPLELKARAVWRRRQRGLDLAVREDLERMRVEIRQRIAAAVRRILRLEQSIVESHFRIDGMRGRDPVNRALDAPARPWRRSATRCRSSREAR